VPGDDPIAQMHALVTSASRSTVAANVLDETADLIGAGIATLINLLNPERVVIGGWVGLEIGPQAIARIRQSAEQNALARLYLQTTIELSTLGADADALGAATQPLAALIAGTLLREPRPGAKVRGRSPRTDVA
jgi:predicted NBD/HSP70 family sugar kinase